MSHLSHRPLSRPGLVATAVATIAAGAVVGTLLVAPANASRVVAEAYPVPADGSYTLTGHGYGHGHGMSQYGAQGAAKQGLSYQQIVGFYYPGTTLATGGGQVRVLITADTDNDVRVAAASGLRVREVGSGATYALPATSGVSMWRLRTVSGATVLEYFSSAWHSYKPGGTALTGVAEFYRAGTLTLKVAGTTRVYRGAMRLASTDTVNVLSMDEYVKGVVPREMPASWEPAAVQAQAVAARTYGSWEREAHLSRYYQTCDTTSCQVYGGVGAEDSRSNAAVDATANRILTYGGKPAFTQFGSSSGGWTSAGSMTYLPAKSDPYDSYSGNPVHTWTKTVTAAAIQAAWPTLGNLRQITITQRDGNGDWYGRVEKMTLEGNQSNVAISGSTFRSKLGLRSQWFTAGAAAAATPTRTATTTSPITARWKAIGGRRSVLGAATSREYRAGAGRARNYKHGRIYYKADTGAHELYGTVLRAYKRRGAATSRLGFPTTRPLRFTRGKYAKFENGVLRVYRSGRVQVIYRG